MAITTSGTTLTFNDATTQTTAPVNTNANVTSATAVAGTGISITSVTTTGAATHTVTNTGVTSAVAGTGITVSGATGAVTISSTATGTVTSVATGNGLSGGTITSTGTLVVACPTFNSVGSYAMGYVLCNDANQPPNLASGATYAAGSGNRQFQSALMYANGPCGALVPSSSNNLSGTWRNMGAGGFSTAAGACFLICRVS
jgi:hypothetical protein